MTMMPLPLNAHRPLILVRHIAALVGMVALSAPLAAQTAPPPQQGTMAVEAHLADGSRDGTTESARDAAGEALSARGFTLLDGADHAAYWMELVIDRSDVGTGDAKVAPSSSNLANGGVPGAAGSVFKVPLPSGKSRHVALQKTRLDMILRKRGSAASVWRGSAVTVRSSDQQDAAATALSGALVRAYPAQSDAVIGVP